MPLVTRCYACGQRKELTKIPWDSKEIEALIDMRKYGASYKTIAENLDRTESACKVQYYRVMRQMENGE